MKVPQLLKNCFKVETDSVLKNEKPGKLNSALLGVYLFFVLTIYVFVTCFYNPPYSVSEVALFMTASAFLIAAVLFFLCPRLLKATGQLYIKYETTKWTRKEKRKLILSFFIPTFSIFFILYILLYPGAFSSDVIFQYSQIVHDIPYNDWHPALQTFLTLTLPLKLTGGWTGSMALFQIIEYSCALTYMAYTIAELGNKYFAIVSLAYVMINPVTWTISVFPMKDVSITIASVVLMSFALRIHFTNGQWINKWYRVVLLAVFFVFTTIFRHNGILLTLPLLFACLFYIDKKKKIQLAALFVILMVLIKGPLYTMMGVEAPDRRHVETLGLPLTVIGNVIKEDPDSLDEETREFIYTIAPKENWEKYYLGDFNTIKWGDKISTDAIENAGAVKILKTAGKCFAASPVNALYALFSLTDMVYSIDGRAVGGIEPSVSPNNYGIKALIPFSGQTITKYSLTIQNSIFKYPFYFIGVVNLGVIILILAKNRLNKWRDWKKILLCIPLLCYSFGTMLLLSGSDFRFFYLEFPLFPMLIFLLLCNEKGNETLSKIKIN